jgi:predicted metal-dependent HD superfamily phosphohydrolase
MTHRLENRWNEFQRSLGVTDAVGTFTVLTANYSQPPRAYHNLRHIAHCLEEFDRARTLARHPLAVEAAIWFHDAIYDSRAKDNESRSAELAAKFLQSAKADSALIDHTTKLILATKSHDPNADVDAPLMVDVDLSILGQSESRFDEYERQIREEYAWVSDKEFAEGRAAVLNSFLNRTFIYSTDFFRKLYESQARANLKRSLHNLKREGANAFHA